MVNKIDSFHGKFRWLSNFWPCHIPWEGIDFTSVENAYASARCVDIHDRLRFVGIGPGEAKKLGRQVKAVPDWDELKLGFMKKFLRLKFRDNPIVADLRRKLLETGSVDLVEGNTWHDNFWGNCNCGREKCKEPGQNNLGKLLMEVRDELRRNLEN